MSAASPFGHERGIRADLGRLPGIDRRSVVPLRCSGPALADRAVLVARRRGSDAAPGAHDD
ncbi:hypothetical protein [Microbacterium sp. UBA1097]|uniref:hypothetical protein n=1 Tax=Microbacterium sp. UBA1097 TaxID=1946941 RepID=UPI0025FA9416|nr:hypothetical protein [Microbacterium sp. UBA1097]